MSSFDLAKLRAGSTLQTPDGAMKVEATEETHSGLVALTRDLAVKVRKPLNLGFLDYSTPVRRAEALTQELALGRRLSPPTYVGLWTTDDGVRFVDGPGAETALIMRRLPTSARMDVVLGSGGLDAAALDRVVRRLVEVHTQAEADRGLQGWGRFENTRQAWEINFEQMPAGAPDHPFTSSEYTGVQNDTARWLDRHEPVFIERIGEGRIRDGHGDLRPEHIYLVEPVALIDPLEFSTALRFTDTGAELGYLAMECEWMGRPDVGRLLLMRYAEQMADTSLGLVAPFFRRYRALVMAKVEWIRASQHLAAAKAAHLERARRYAALTLNTELT